MYVETVNNVTLISIFSRQFTVSGCRKTSLKYYYFSQQVEFVQVLPRTAGHWQFIHIRSLITAPPVSTFRLRLALKLQKLGEIIEQTLHPAVSDVTFSWLLFHIAAALPSTFFSLSRSRCQQLMKWRERNVSKRCKNLIVGGSCSLLYELKVYNVSL